MCEESVSLVANSASVHNIVVASQNRGLSEDIDRVEASEAQKRHNPDSAILGKA